MLINKVRLNRLAPNGIPKYVRCYDAGEKFMDRFTVVFTGNFKGRNGRSHYRGMSENPTHPMGFGQWGEAEGIIDRPGYSHLGRPVAFRDLPQPCRNVVMRDYWSIWGLNSTKP